MTINSGVKGTLAKLLATEDIVVEHRKCQTAQFDVERRVLTLPIWEGASETVYDMLVAHEVGHALFTPNEDWSKKVQCPQTFINVVEDARIEKLMKRKYQGLPKTFFNGYKELNEEDFFEIEGNTDKFEFIDRINLHFKVGNFTYVAFTDEEQALVDKVSSAETFDEVCAISDEIFAHMKAEFEAREEDEEDELENAQPISFPSADGEGGEGESEDGEGTETNLGEDEQTPDQEIINPNQPWDKAEDSTKESGEVTHGNVGGGEGANFHPEGKAADSSLEARTDQIFNKKIQDYVQTGGYETEYVEIPKVDPKKLIIDWKEVIKVCDENYKPHDMEELQKQTYTDDWKLRSFARENEELIRSENDYKQFYKDSQKEVNYLVKEFEMRKSAGAYARATTSRTGVLDTTKLFQYKYNEDIFKKITVLPDGKNHGMVFILDWSGSMSNCLMDTVKQVLQLAYFCNKVQIPFTVLGFGYNYSGFRHDESERFKGEMGKLSFSNGFALMEMLTSEVNKKDFYRLALALWRNAGANSYSRNNGYGSRQYDFRTPHGLSLSGTPLIESVAAMHSYLPQFIKATGAEKVSISILSDGESASAQYYTKREAIWGDKYYANCFGHNCQLRDRKKGKVYPKKDNPSDQLNVFLQNLKESFPQVSLIGFRLVSPRDANGYFRLSQYMGYFSKGIDEVIKTYRKQKFYAFTDSPYDKLFVMPINNVDDTDEMDKLEEGASKKEVTAAFKKMFKNKKSNKRMLTSFAETVG